VKEATTTIAVHKDTKKRLDESKAPGQNYNGFIAQMLELWERNRAPGKVFQHK